MRALLLGLLLVAAAMAGCNGGTGDGEGGDPGPSTSASGSGAPVVPHARLLADRGNGTVPVAVNFTLAAAAGAQAWRLSYGDGGLANGTGQPPATANHTYAVAGDFSAVLNVTYPSGAAVANVSLTILLGDDPPLPPAHFEFGESFGCAPASDYAAAPFSCLSFQGGPEATGFDGHWLALDERYWGLALTSVTEQSPVGPVDVPQLGTVGADSDCSFVKADTTTLLGDGNNGEFSCTAVVPVDAAFLFIYPYAAPGFSITLDFSFPSGTA